MQETETNSFGKVLKAERKRLGWSQQELADQVGVTQQNVGNWERGENMPKQAALDKLIEVLGPDSPVAATRLKPELRVLPYISEPLPDYLRYGTQADPHVQSYTPVRTHAPKPGMFRDTHLQLATLLPPELQKHLGRKINQGRATYIADYLSDKVCICLKRIIRTSSVAKGEQSYTMFNLRRTQRDALFQLTALRKVNKNQSFSASNIRYVLIYLAPDEETAMWAESSAPLLEEARLFDVHLRVTSSLEKVASIIKFYESSDLSSDEGVPVEEIDDEEWLNN